jgi:hypothetical protein
MRVDKTRIGFFIAREARRGMKKNKKRPGI